MKVHVRGRSLGVVLTGDVDVATSQLEGLGFSKSRATEVAAAATRFAEEETDQLERLLMPRSAWPGSAFVRRHMGAQREETWLMLKYDNKSAWTLEAAFMT
jgi:hypothetical protein